MGLKSAANQERHQWPDPKPVLVVDHYTQIHRMHSYRVVVKPFRVATEMTLSCIAHLDGCTVVLSVPLLLWPEARPDGWRIPV